MRCASVCCVTERDAYEEGHGNLKSDVACDKDGDDALENHADDLMPLWADVA